MGNEVDLTVQKVEAAARGASNPSKEAYTALATEWLENWNSLSTEDFGKYTAGVLNKLSMQDKDIMDGITLQWATKKSTVGTGLLHSKDLQWVNVNADGTGIKSADLNKFLESCGNSQFADCKIGAGFTERWAALQGMEGGKIERNDLPWQKLTQEQLLAKIALLDAGIQRRLARQ